MILTSTKLQLLIPSNYLTICPITFKFQPGINMDRYYLTTELLGLWDEKTTIPIFRGPRYRRYQSIDKILDLTEIASKSAPPFPLHVLNLNPFDDEWDDQMTYIKVNYNWLFHHTLSFISLPLMMYVYNHNFIHYNFMYRGFKWFLPLVVIMQFESGYKYYRTQVTKALLFDEYVQARADELVAQKEHLLKSEGVKKFIRWSIDYKETLKEVKREACNNADTDFKQAEIALQSFINRWVDPSVGIKAPFAGPNYPSINQRE
jgi:hypothetical protein